MTTIPQMQIPVGDRVTPRDIVALQQFVAKAIADLPLPFQLVSNKPASASSAGSVGDVYVDTSGTLYLCVATSKWFVFTGSTF